MIDAYAVGVQAKLDDAVTPALLRIIDTLNRTNAGMLELTANLRDLSSAGSAVARSLDRAASRATALGDATGALTRASYVLDTMAASSADLARNMAAARAEGRGLGYGSGGSGGVVVPAGGRGRDDDSRGRFSRNAAAGLGISGAYGLYENARLQDINIRAAATSQVPFPMWIQTADELRQREMAYAAKYAFATGGRIAPFGEAMLESSRLLRTLSPADQRVLTDSAMPYAAVEAKLKGVALPEAMQAFIGLAHQAGAYTPGAATPLFESMMQASLTTHASLNQIARASSYALPALHAAGANSSDVMLMLATMMQAGILNTKSGTWLNALAMNALPNSLGSGLFTNKKQNAALEDLGLYRNGHAQFYRNGQFDLMQEVAILAAARQRLSPLEFNAATRQAFGMQGQRAASLFAEPQVVQNLATLASLTTHAQSPMSVAGAVNALSMVAKADQTIANANITLMNATQTFMGPANAALSGASSFFGWSAKFTGAHPVVGGAMDAGLAVGAAGLLGAAWRGGTVGVEALGKKVIPFVARGIWGVVTRALGGITASALEAGAAGVGVLAAEAVPIVTGAVTAAVGYGIGTVLNKALNAAARNLTHGTHDTWWGAIFHNEGTRAALTPQALAELQQLHNAGSHAAQTPPVVVQLDGEEIRHHILRSVPATPARGAQGVNPVHSPLSPGLNYAPGL